MKQVIKNIAGFLSAGILFVIFSGCVEHRYYREHHQHSPEYYHRHHREPPPGVDINIHN